jgi:hypothetical protein
VDHCNRETKKYSKENGNNPWKNGKLAQIPVLISPPVAGKGIIAGQRMSPNVQLQAHNASMTLLISLHNLRTTQSPLPLTGVTPIHSSVALAPSAACLAVSSGSLFFSFSAASCSISPSTPTSDLHQKLHQ